LTQTLFESIKNPVQNHSVQDFFCGKLKWSVNRQDIPQNFWAFHTAGHSGLYLRGCVREAIAK
jgi:hypothetical protein